MLRVEVGDWLLRVNGISCKHMPRAEVKRYIVGPAGTKVELVFASKRDKKNITVQLLRMPKEKGTEVEFTAEINHERDRSDGERERDRGRGRSPRQETYNCFFLWVPCKRV
jgi:C-terminal processing protease CtpA/Prc